MKNLSDIINKSQVVYESVSNRRIMGFIDFLSSIGLGFNKFCRSQGYSTPFMSIEWDKIDNSCITEYDAHDYKSFKKKLHDAGEHTFAFIMRDEKYIGIYCSLLYFRFYRSGEDTPILKSGRTDYKEKEGYSVNRYSTATAAADEVLKDATHFYVVDYSEHNTFNLRSSRAESQRGVVKNDDKYYEMIAKSNMDRYRKLAIQMRANRSEDKEGKEIDELVQNTILRCIKVISAFRATPEKWPGISYEISWIARGLEDTTHYEKGKTVGSQGLVSLYNRYVTYSSSLKTASSTLCGYSDENTIKSNMAATAVAIRKQVESLDKSLKKFE